MSEHLSRRQFLIAGGAGAAASLAAPISPISAAMAKSPSEKTDFPQPPTILPPALRPGDTIAIISPANATYPREPFELAIETIEAMGFRAKPAPNWKARYGHFAGTDAQRADAVNAMFADASVHGMLALTGGSGCTRILDRLDYPLIAQNPKVIGGMSDLTALLNGIYRRTGVLTFHSPTVGSSWNPYALDNFRRVAMAGEAALQRNPVASENLPVQKKYRTRTLVPGTARGRLIGGNLTVLATLAGTAYWPDFNGAILFIEDINEHIYRLDRVLAHLRLAGAFKNLAGVVIGQFTNCEPGDGYGTLTLDEVFGEYFGSLGVPVYTGAMFGHIAEKMTFPVGAQAEIDADKHEIRLLTPAVRV
jgi:muramoyltetrapeptide carboxypeptidase